MNKTTKAQEVLQWMCALIIASCVSLLSGLNFASMAFKDGSLLSDLQIIFGVVVMLSGAIYCAFKARQYYRHINFIVGMTVHSGD